MVHFLHKVSLPFLGSGGRYMATAHVDWGSERWCIGQSSVTEKKNTLAAANLRSNVFIRRY